MPQKFSSRLVCRLSLCIDEKDRFAFTMPLECLLRQNNSLSTTGWSRDEHELSVIPDHLFLLFIKPQSLVFLASVLHCFWECLHIFTVAKNCSRMIRKANYLIKTTPQWIHSWNFVQATVTKLYHIYFKNQILLYLCSLKVSRKSKFWTNCFSFFSVNFPLMGFNIANTRTGNSDSAI